MNEKQKRWLIYGGIVLLALILAAIISPWILLPGLIMSLIVMVVVFAGEASKEVQRPPVPVYQPPVQPATEAEQPLPAPYTQGYQAQPLSAKSTSSFPFTPPGPEPQPHIDPPGAPVYEQSLVQYPEQP